MRDGPVAFINSVAIPLVTRKNKYEINALMKKAFYDNIWTEDIKQQQRNGVYSFFNVQLN